MYYNRCDYGPSCYLINPNNLNYYLKSSFRTSINSNSISWYDFNINKNIKNTEYMIKSFEEFLDQLLSKEVMYSTNKYTNIQILVQSVTRENVYLSEIVFVNGNDINAMTEEYVKYNLVSYFEEFVIHKLYEFDNYDNILFSFAYTNPAQFTDWGNNFKRWLTINVDNYEGNNKIDELLYWNFMSTLNLYGKISLMSIQINYVNKNYKFDNKNNDKVKGLINYVYYYGNKAKSIQLKKENNTNWYLDSDTEIKTLYYN